MKDILFSDNFVFHTFVHRHNYHISHAKGAPLHFFAYIEEGSCRLVSDRVEVKACAGEVFYIPEGLKYQSYWFCDEKVQFKSFGFRCFPEAVDRQYSLQKIHCDEYVKEMLCAIPTERTTDSMLLGSFYNFVAAVLPAMQYQEQSSRTMVIEKAKQYIFKNGNCGVPDIARHCAISQTALYDIFRRDVGCTPNELRKRFLCERAVLLLTTTDQPVQNISDSLGFSSTSYFRKTLQKHTGKTPSQIRKAAKHI